MLWQDCFDSLLKLLSWSWNTFCASLCDTRDLRGASLAAAMLDLDRLVYVSCACLRLIKVFIAEVYPSNCQWISSETFIMYIAFMLLDSCS